jgi:hypothetical protein
MRHERDIGFFGFLHLFCAPGHRNLLDGRSGDPRRFSRKLSFWRVRLIRNYSLSRRSSHGIWLRFLVVTANRKHVLYNPKERSKENNGTRGNTYESIRSKNLTPSSSKGASAAAVFYAEVLEDVKSSTRFLFLSAPVSSDSAGGGDIIELVSSSDSSASSLSWFSSASGASDTMEARSARRGPASGRGGREMRNR